MKKLHHCHPMNSKMTKITYIRHSA